MPAEHLPDHLSDFLARLPTARRYVVAFSGGLDSTVLLHALARLRRSFRPELHAVHVNHGLHAQAAEQAAWCRREAARLKAGFALHEVQVDTGAGRSLEATAREARYAALRAGLQPGDILFTAQHQDDQLETFLLMALRGSGPAGLAAMASLSRFAPGWLARPLLDVPRRELEVWADTQGLAWCEDPSNLEIRYDRNYLRHEVLPLLRARWPSAGEALGRSARHCAAAARQIEALAAADLVHARREDEQVLSVARLLRLTAERRHALVRYWLSRLGLPAPPEKVLNRLADEVLQAGADRQPKLAWRGGELRRYRDSLYALAPLAEWQPPPPLHWENPSERLVLPAGNGSLELCPGGALSRTRLAGCRLSVRFRRGGELLQLDDGHRHELKTLLQEAGVLPWMRERLPLLYADGVLAAVPELAVAAGFRATDPADSCRLHWRGGPRLR